MTTSYLLMLRFIILNVIGAALLALSWVQGWFTTIVSQDITRISLLIVGVFLVGWFICAHKIVKCSRELNLIHQGEDAQSRTRWYRELVDKATLEARGAIADCLRARLYARITVVRTISNNLIILGLIGTVIGFIIALSGIEADAVADVGAVAPMVSTLIDGMSVALFTTLVGAVFHVWLTMCYQVLATGTVNLANAIIETAETGDFSLPADIL